MIYIPNIIKAYKKLAAGVEVVPKIGERTLLYWQGRGDGTKEAFEINGQMVIPDADGVAYLSAGQAAKFFGFDTAIAAARVKAIEECLLKFGSGSSLTIYQRIEALIGANK